VESHGPVLISKIARLTGGVLHCHTLFTSSSKDLSFNKLVIVYERRIQESPSKDRDIVIC
jgi:hypothetical protein